MPAQGYEAKNLDSRGRRQTASDQQHNPPLTLGGFSEYLREQYATQTPPTEHAPTDQKADEAAVLIVTIITFFTFMLLILLVPPFAQKMREQKPA
jgi:hypothetical protein